MLLTAVSWLIMFIIFFSLGIFTSTGISYVFKIKIQKIYPIIIIGFVTTTIYAESVSLFYPLKKEAFLILLFLCVLILFLYKNQLISYVINRIEKLKKNQIRTVALLIIYFSIICLISYLASRTPGGYDTENYHIPSIRWLEEYGAVKGLGNLHTRFAYNSAVLCLQSLFSFSWLFPFSMHSLNGFMLAFFIIYCINTFKFFKFHKIYLSDFFRILFFLLLLRGKELAGIASPNTDSIPMYMIAYIFIEWCNLTETRGCNYIHYALISILGLFCMSLKLSSAILFFFALAPLVKIIQRRQFLLLCYCTVFSVAVIIPFLARNLIISGYLIYPSSFLNIFNFDWKIPYSVMVSDNTIIKAFARSWGSGYSFLDISRNFSEWFPIWCKKAPLYFRILGIFNLCLSIASLCYLSVSSIISRKVCYKNYIVLMAAVGFLFLLFTAPSVRFGRIWFYLLPCILLHYITTVTITFNKFNTWRITKKQFVTMVLIAETVIFSFLLYFEIFQHKGDHINSIYILPKDYPRGKLSEFLMLNNIKFYYAQPFKGNLILNGYDGFPGTESRAVLEKIEMRGKSLGDGFRVKKEFKNIPYHLQGGILNKKELEAMKLNSCGQLTGKN